MKKEKKIDGPRNGCSVLRANCPDMSVLYAGDVCNTVHDVAAASGSLSACFLERDT